MMFIWLSMIRQQFDRWHVKPQTSDSCGFEKQIDVETLQKNNSTKKHTGEKVWLMPGERKIMLQKLLHKFFFVTVFHALLGERTSQCNHENSKTTSFSNLVEILTCDFLHAHLWDLWFRPPKNRIWVAGQIHLKKCIPSRELIYPTLGKGESSSKCNFLGDMLVPWKVILMGSHGAFFQPVMLVSFEGGINGVTKDGLSPKEWNL